MSKRMSSPLVRGQSKTSNSNSNNNNNNSGSSSLNGDRINGTMNSSSSYDNMRPLGNADSDIDGLQVSSISSTQNGLSKADFRYIARDGISLIPHTKVSFSTRSDYPPITKVEQRRRYKTEFDKDYTEYRQLHKIMEKARNRFANLQDELRKVHPSDERKYKVTKNCSIYLLSTSAFIFSTEFW